MSQPAQLMRFIFVHCLGVASLPAFAVSLDHRNRGLGSRTGLRGNLRASARLPEDKATAPEGAPNSPLEYVEAIEDIVSDLELRQNPVAAPDGMPEVGLQEALDAERFFKESGDSFKHCAVIHQYAEPLMVTDGIAFDVGSAKLSLNGGKELPPLFKKAPILDEHVSKDHVSLRMNMHARLDGIAGLVQVVPHGLVAHWQSKDKVPLAGFLCFPEDSAPVLHSAPTPCVPTSVARDGTALGPDDGFEVFIGTTVVKFANKTQADDFCLEYATKIAADLEAKVWDASSLGARLPRLSPTVQSFMKLTRRETSPQAWTKGTKRLLVVIMDWKDNDNSLAPYSEQEYDPIPNYQEKIFPDVARHFREMSYGQFGIDVTFVPWVVQYSRERIRYTAQGQLPFPALYEGARTSLEGTTDEYNFDSFDLVFVIAPQVQPVGTKGVAFVGRKGAMCNGCELLSSQYKTMVIVHEIGHNLGLFHASSTTLEYGNPFDWMGNYPDGKGLHYGAGYSWSLGWLADEFVYTLSDADFKGGDFSAAVVLAPVDSGTPPAKGQVVGIRISLKENSRDLWVSFRATTGGIFLVRQEKDQADSELIDCGCHTPSQDDAHLSVGWTFMDNSHKYAIKAEMVSETTAKVLVFAVPAEQAPKIYGRDTFTDGVTKCPITCVDTNWLIPAYGCSTMSEQGYCKGGSVSFMGTKYSIGREVCPESCGKCKDILASTPQLVANACADKSVNINGRSCPEVAAAGWCMYQTTSGSKIGREICPQSCGLCPRALKPDKRPFKDPKAKETIGALSTGPAPAPAPAPATAAPSAAAPPEVEPSAGSNSELMIKSSVKPYSGETVYGVGAPAPAAPDGVANTSDCADDPKWKDADGDGCSVYAQSIEIGDMTLEEACQYGKGEAEHHCRKTCGACAAAAKVKKPQVIAGCDDDPSWVDIDGHSCAAYAASIEIGNLTAETACSYNVGAAKAYCRRTCDTCVFTRNNCADSVCVGRWKEKLGRCYQCADHSKHCKEDWFRSECPLTCKQCRPSSLAITREQGGKLSQDVPAGPKKACEDRPCVEAYKVGKDCPSCAQLGESFCSEDVFATTCPRTCRLCAKGIQAPPCEDIYEKFTCSRYKRWGWCSRKDTKEQCAHTCGACPVAEGTVTTNATSDDDDKSGAGMKHGLRCCSFWIVLCAVLVMSW